MINFWMRFSVERERADTYVIQDQPGTTSNATTRDSIDPKAGKAFASIFARMTIWPDDEVLISYGKGWLEIRDVVCLINMLF